MKKKTNESDSKTHRCKFKSSTNLSDQSKTAEALNSAELLYKGYTSSFLRLCKYWTFLSTVSSTHSNDQNRNEIIKSEMWENVKYVTYTTCGTMSMPTALYILLTECQMRCYIICWVSYQELRLRKIKIPFQREVLISTTMQHRTWAIVRVSSLHTAKSSTPLYHIAISSGNSI